VRISTPAPHVSGFDQTRGPGRCINLEKRPDKISNSGPLKKFRCNGKEEARPGGGEYETILKDFSHKAYILDQTYLQ